MGELQRQPKLKGPRSQREGKLVKGRLTVNPASRETPANWQAAVPRG